MYDAAAVDDEELKARMAADMAQIARTHMPFGRFGPENFPPHGLPIYDLPAEYLQYFAVKKGRPRGRLGELLRIVYQMKADGADAAFDVLRSQAGGRRPLRKPRRKDHKF